MITYPIQPLPTPLALSGTSEPLHLLSVSFDSPEAGPRSVEVRGISKVAGQVAIDLIAQSNQATQTVTLAASPSLFSATISISISPLDRFLIVVARQVGVTPSEETKAVVPLL